MKSSKIVAALVTIVMLASGATINMPPATAEAGGCQSNFGAKTPILMVHGLNSGPDMWDSAGSGTAMKTALGQIQDAQVVEPFNYHDNHFDWVTNPNIGPKLATTIDCLAQASRHNGGSGKVMIVAHSMGGLAARYAANQTIDGRKVAGEIGLVVTLGTPHLGSDWATIFGQGPRWYCEFASTDQSEVQKCVDSPAIKALSAESQELRNLPQFPSQVPVLAIAGRVKVYAQFMYTQLQQQLSDDLFVSVESATAEYTTMGKLDGKLVFDCTAYRYASNNRLNDGECSHNEMYKTGYIQDAVKNSISAHLSSSLPANTQATEMLNGLTIPVPVDYWGGAMSEPNQVQNLVDYSNCKGGITAECPHIMVFNTADSYLQKEYGGDALAGMAKERCGTSAPVAEGQAKIGAATADFFVQTSCNQPGGPAAVYYWRVKEKNVLIMAADQRGDKMIDLDLLRTVLAHSTWR